MIRASTIVSFMLACGSGLYLYQSKHEAQVLDRTIEKTVRETAAYREQSRLLAAEWTMLNDPDTLRKFSDSYLALKTSALSQFTSLADLDGRLPAVQLPASPDPPDDAARVPVANLTASAVPTLLAATVHAAAPALDSAAEPARSAPPPAAAAAGPAHPVERKLPAAANATRTVPPGRQAGADLPYRRTVQDAAGTTEHRFADIGASPGANPLGRAPSGLAASGLAASGLAPSGLATSPPSGTTVANATRHPPAGAGSTVRSFMAPGPADSAPATSLITTAPTVLAVASATGKPAAPNATAPGPVAAGSGPAGSGAAPAASGQTTSGPVSSGRTLAATIGPRPTAAGSTNHISGNHPAAPSPTPAATQLSYGGSLLGMARGAARPPEPRPTPVNTSQWYNAN